mmetsp:Transcript_19545/g.26839  ORF Transcript_19545/g.26839 Transcript_19545/m.26839 type:complete len:180 (-) Transcript_19545:566-1105(-)
MDITPVLPQSDGKIDFDMLDCSTSGPEVAIVEDFELQASPNNAVSVIELIGNESKVLFYTDCSRPLLVLYVKNIQRFLKIILLCEDDTGTEIKFEFSNNNSFVSVDKHGHCKLPLEIDFGWQYICMDLEDIVANACGTTFSICKEVTVCGSCRLLKMYFQSKRFADCELPNYLRLVGIE